MKSAIVGKSSVFCPYFSCPSALPEGFQGPRLSPRIRKRGRFRRLGSLKRIRRYSCLHCRRSFSEASSEPEFRQKKRHLNEQIRRVLCSTVSERRAAKLLGVNRKLIAHRVRFQSALDRKAHEQELELRASDPTQRVEKIQWDEMESFEHTQCKPLSIGLAVNAKTREILGISMARMPASGPLAQISRKKYGPRKDERAQAAKALLASLAPAVHTACHIASDQNPKYPAWIQATLPQAQHTAYKGGRGATVGYGELKKLRFDPLFSLNHTAAMIRANVNRLLRRTWCTTKKPENLLARLHIYMRYHNTQLIQSTSLG